MGRRTKRGKVTTDPVYPRKRLFRARAHGNPLSDSIFSVPASPDEIDWSVHYPVLKQGSKETGVSSEVRFLDVGCGYGGLTVSLAQRFPTKLILGMELRDKIAEFLKQRIDFLRETEPGCYQNISCVRANAMKQLPNYFRKGQLEKMFFLFPDPHFKTANHRRRIINTHLLTVYGHFLRPGGVLYTTTDVEELSIWMKERLDEHPLFESLTDEELEADEIVPLLLDSSEEGKKVLKNRGKFFRFVYRRKDSPVFYQDTKEQDESTVLKDV